jgi:hypothetical protein
MQQLNGVGQMMKGRVTFVCGRANARGNRGKLRAWGKDHAATQHDAASGLADTVGYHSSHSDYRRVIHQNEASDGCRVPRCIQPREHRPDRMSDEHERATNARPVEKRVKVIDVRPTPARLR